MIILEVLTTRWRVSHLKLGCSRCMYLQNMTWESQRFLLGNSQDNPGGLGIFETFWDQNLSDYHILKWAKTMNVLSEAKGSCFLSASALKTKIPGVNSTRRKQVVIHIPTVIHSGHSAQGAMFLEQTLPYELWLLVKSSFCKKNTMSPCVVSSIPRFGSFFSG